MYSLSGAEIKCLLSILEKVCIIEVVLKEDMLEFCQGKGNCL